MSINTNRTTPVGGGKPPETESAAEQSIQANAVQQSGAANTNVTTRLKAPPSVLKDEPGGSPQATQGGSANTNVTRTA